MVISSYSTIASCTCLYIFVTCMPPYFQTVSPLEMDFYVLLIFISLVPNSEGTVYLTSYEPSISPIPITTTFTLVQGIVSSHLAHCHSLLHAEGVVNIE